MVQLGKIRRDHSKERLKIIKTDKFESDLLKTHEDIALQSCQNLRCLYGGRGGGASLCPSPYKRLLLLIKANCCVFEVLCVCPGEELPI